MPIDNQLKQKKPSTTAVSKRKKSVSVNTEPEDIITPCELFPTPTEPNTPNKKCIYPLFTECAQYTLDPYWHQVFEECSRGHFPRGSGIDPEGKVIYFRTKNQANSNNRNYISYRIKKNPEKVFKDLKQFFQEQLNFKSNQDRQEIRNELDVICKGLQDSYTGSWKEIKRKKIRDPIIRRYILALKDKYTLTDKETAEVAQIIKLGFLFNWISNDKVIYEDQQILDIQTLHFDPEDRSFELEEPHTNYKREYTPKIQKLSSLWEKHLKSPKNRYIL